MSEQEYAKIIAKNLRRIMYDCGKTQVDVARDLKISKATVSSWMNGTRTPKIKNIDLLCHYFNVKRSDIMEVHEDPKNGQDSGYYEPETLEMAQALYDNPDLRALMEAAMTLNKDSIPTLTKLLYEMKGTNPDG